MLTFTSFSRLEIISKIRSNERCDFRNYFVRMKISWRRCASQHRAVWNFSRKQSNVSRGRSTRWAFQEEIVQNEQSSNPGKFAGRKIGVFGQEFELLWTSTTTSARGNRDDLNVSGLGYFLLSLDRNNRPNDTSSQFSFSVLEINAFKCCTFI